MDKKINEMCYDLPIIGVIEDGNEDAKKNIPRNNFAALIDTSKKILNYIPEKLKI